MVMRIYEVFESIEFQKAYLKMMDEELENYADFRQRHGVDEVRIAVNSVGIFFEGVGVLAKRKLISMDLVDDLLSSNILRTWEKIKPIAEGARKKAGHPQIWEWFEYLYNEMNKREQKLQQSKA
jgi:hypothetical protein